MPTVGDGRLGYPDGAPYDAIHVGAAAATVPKAVRTQALVRINCNKNRHKALIQL